MCKKTYGCKTKDKENDCFNCSYIKKPCVGNHEFTHGICGDEKCKQDFLNYAG